MGVCRVTAEDSRARREPFSIVAELVRGRGVSESRAREWEQAAEEADRRVTLPGWLEALAPGCADLQVGVRPVYRPAARVDRRRARTTRPERRTADARMGNARLDVPPPRSGAPRAWWTAPAGSGRCD